MHTGGDDKTAKHGQPCNNSSRSYMAEYLFHAIPMSRQAELSERLTASALTSVSLNVRFPHQATMEANGLPDLQGLAPGRRTYNGHHARADSSGRRASSLTSGTHGLESLSQAMHPYPMARARRPLLA